MRLPIRLFCRQAQDIIEYTIPKDASKLSVYFLRSSVKNVVSVKKVLSEGDWKKLHSVIPFPGFGYHAFHVMLNSGRELSDIRKLISALQSIKVLNPVLKSQLLPAFYTYPKDCTDIDYKFITETCDEVLSKFPVLTLEVGNLLVGGLSVTPLWKEKTKAVMSLLKDKVDTVTLSTVARGAFLHNDCEYGWQLLKEAIFTGKNFDPKVYHAILDCHERFPAKKNLFKLLNFLEAHSYMLPISVAERASKILETEGNWVSRFAEVKTSGHCSCCDRKLNKLPLSSEEHTQLLNMVEDAFDVNNKYNTYEKEEVSNFKAFLKKCPPYTVVLDGPNIFYRAGEKEIMGIIQQLVRKRHKILFICRSHLKNSKLFRDAMKGHLSYYVKNSTKDDTFIIYAALSSGPNTLVVSNDYFGLYYSSIRRETRVLFKRWQLSNQVLGVGIHCKHLVFPTYSPVCQSSEDGSSLHIPLTVDDYNSAFAPSAWVCVQKVSKEQKENANQLWPKRPFQVSNQKQVDAFRMYGTQISSQSILEQSASGKKYKKNKGKFLHNAR